MQFKRAHTGLLALAFTLSAGAVQAGDFADGFVAAEQGDYQKAASEWKSLAEHGNAQAQFNMALLYHSGAAGKIDEAKAVQLYRRAAENGYPQAQEYMVVGYREGWFGLKKDAKKAQYWEQRLYGEN